MEIAMTKRRNMLFPLILLFLFVSAADVFAEGSANWNSVSNNSEVLFYSGNNQTIDDKTISGHNGVILTPETNLNDNRLKYLYTFAKAGERIYLGTSLPGDTDTSGITLVFPKNDGTANINRAEYNNIYGGVEMNISTSRRPQLGFISSHTNELRGPMTCSRSGSNCKSEGYTPAYFDVEQTGIYTIIFRTPTGTGDASSAAQKDIQFFDVSVASYTDNDSLPVIIPGRTFTYLFYILMPDQDARAKNFSYYTLTRDGYVYKNTLHQFNGIYCIFAGSEKGIVDYYNGNRRINHTLKIPVRTTLGQFGPMPATTENSSLLFFNYPDQDLQEFVLGFRGVRPSSDLSNFTFRKNVSAPGGTFSFDIEFPDFLQNETAQNLPFEIYFVTSEGVYVSLQGTASATRSADGRTVHVEKAWNGLDSEGNTVDSGTYSVILRSDIGRSDFMLWDIEYNPGGVTVEQLNGANAGSRTIYYDNSRKTISGVLFEAVNDKKDYSLNGVDSSSPAFKGAADQLYIDYWVYNPSEDIQITIDLDEVSVSKTVRKIWDDQDNRDGFRPESIEFILYCDGTECGNNPYRLTERDGWVLNIDDLPSAGTYSVVETGVTP